MHKNDVVAIVTIEKNTENEKCLHVIELSNEALLPFGVKSASQNTIDGLLSDWYEARCFPSCRPNYEETCDLVGINGSVDLLQYSYLCSLTDCYWFKPIVSDVTWEEVNFHRNGFKSNFAEHLFYGNHDESIDSLNTPDITTDGALPKMWEEINDDFVLIKGHTGKVPADACNEVIADAVMKELQIEHVEYQLVERNGHMYSACKCFITSDTEEFIPIESLMRDYGCIRQSELLQILIQMGFKDDLERMFLADSIIGNSDRHARNYGFIIDSNTLEIKRFAPLFDHGICCIAQNHGYLDYRPTDQTFNKTVQNLSPNVLQLINNVNIDNIRSTVQILPLDDSIKTRMCEQLESRINKLIALSNRHTY
jgi:hypothetical protein